MPDLDQTALVEMTSEVVAAYIGKNHVQPSELPALIASVHAAFDSLGKPPVVEPTAEPLKPAVPIKKSVTDEYIISLEDGRKFKSMKRYLRSSRHDAGRLPRQVGSASRLSDGGTGLRGAPLDPGQDDRARSQAPGGGR